MTATMDPNEITRVIDGVYKNILENFNPASRQMIATGKAYLKSLQGASAACSLYLEALGKLSRQAQQSSLGCAGDIGLSLVQATDVFKEIHTQQLSTLKAFYVDFLVPLETNLEKDTRVIQNEQKKFLMSHKQRIEGFSKAASNAKKVRKKSRKSNSSSALDKEIKVIQNLEDERTKLETFCENSLKDALTQERRRYGFILERKSSMAKHYLAFYSKGNTLLNHKLENWMKVAKSREGLPEAMQANLLKRIQNNFQGEEDCIFCNPPRPADDTVSISSQLRKTKSMDAAEILNVSSQQDVPLNGNSTGTLNKSKSEVNLGMTNGGGDGQNSSTPVSFNEEMQMQSITSTGATRPKSLAVSASAEASQGFVKALYAYLSSGDNQLCFLEGDTIALIGEKNKGWQFGENLRTTKTGWFPVAYTEFDPSCEYGVSGSSDGSPLPPPMQMPPPPAAAAASAACSTFQQKRLNLADVMVHRTPESLLMNSNPKCGGGGLKSPKTPTGNLCAASTQTPTTPTTSLLLPGGGSRSASDSLHSSNDSGFSNDLGNGPKPQIPPQPDVDYSDDEPQLSNSEDLNSGDKWLMDRYQKSEVARLGEVVGKGPRRSLSFGNISASGDLDEGTKKMKSQMPNKEPGHRGRALLVNQSSFRYGNKENSNEGKDGGALQKFLTRTKSLIWKGGQNSNGNARKDRSGAGQRPLDHQGRFDSISNAGSIQDLWGSHNSIVYADAGKRRDKKSAAAQYEMKQISSQSHKLEREYNARNQNTQGQGNHGGSPSGSTSSSDPKMQHAPLPPPPPPPPNSTAAKKQHQHREELPLPPPLRRPQNKAPQPPTTTGNQIEQRERRPLHRTVTPIARKIEQIQPEPELSTEESFPDHQHVDNDHSSEINRPWKSSSRVSRVESFSGSEAPIIPIPMQRTHGHLKNRAGSGGRHSQGQRPRANGNNSGFGKSTYAGRAAASKHSRYIQPVDVENSDNDEVDNFEDEDDASTVNENDNDYDDNASSVYVVEPPPPMSMEKGHRRTNRAGPTLKSQSMRIQGNSKGIRSLVAPTYGHGQSRNNPNPSSPSVTKLSTTVEKSINLRGGSGRGKRPSRIKGSIHSEFHTVELIASDGEGGKEKPIFDYGNHIHRRLYYPERSSRMDQKSERTGNLCGPWYDLWGIDPSVSFG